MFVRDARPEVGLHTSRTGSLLRPSRRPGRSMRRPLRWGRPASGPGRKHGRGGSGRQRRVRPDGGQRAGGSRVVVHTSAKQYVDPWIGWPRGPGSRMRSEEWSWPPLRLCVQVGPDTAGGGLPRPALRILLEAAMAVAKSDQFAVYSSESPGRVLPPS